MLELKLAYIGMGLLFAVCVHIFDEDEYDLSPPVTVFLIVFWLPVAAAWFLHSVIASIAKPFRRRR